MPENVDLVPMAIVVNQKALHEFILLKCKEQTMAFEVPLAESTEKQLISLNVTIKLNSTLLQL